MRAKMGAALSNDGTLDRGAASRAGFPLSLINAELILKMPAFISPIKRGTVLLYGMFQCLADRVP